MKSDQSFCPNIKDSNIKDSAVRLSSIVTPLSASSPRVLDASASHYVLLPQWKTLRAAPCCVSEVLQVHDFRTQFWLTWMTQFFTFQKYLLLRELFSKGQTNDENDKNIPKCSFPFFNRFVIDYRWKKMTLQCASLRPRSLPLSALLRISQRAEGPCAEPKTSDQKHLVQHEAVWIGIPIND